MASQEVSSLQKLVKSTSQYPIIDHTFPRFLKFLFFQGKSTKKCSFYNYLENMALLIYSRVPNKRGVLIIGKRHTATSINTHWYNVDLSIEANNISQMFIFTSPSISYTHCDVDLVDFRLLIFSFCISFFFSSHQPLPTVVSSY